MPTTANHAWVTPDGSEEPQVHLDLQSLADQLDSDVPFRGAAAPAHKGGRIWINSTDNSINFSNGVAWSTWDTRAQTYVAAIQNLIPGLSTQIHEYFRKGPTCKVMGSVTLGTGFSLNTSDIQIGLPFPALAAWVPGGSSGAFPLGTSGLVKPGVGWYMNHVRLDTTGYAVLMGINSTHASAPAVNTTFAWSLEFEPA